MKKINKNSTSDLISYLLFMWKYLKDQKLQLWLLSAMIVVFIVTGRLIPIIFGWAIDFGIAEKNMRLIYIFGAALLACNILRGALSFVTTYGFRYLGQKVLFSMRKELVDHVQKLPMKFFDKTASGRIVTRISNDTRSLGDLFSEGFAGIFINLIEIISIVISLFWVAWPLALLVLVAFPPVLWMSYVLSEQIKKQYIVIKSKLSTINTFTAESIDGIQVIQLYGGEEKTQQHFAKEVEDYKELQLDAHKLFAKLWPILELFQVICIILSIAFGMFLMRQDMLSVGAISAFILLLQSFFRPLRYILEKYNQVQNGITSSQRIIGLLQEPQELQEPQKLQEPQEQPLAVSTAYAGATTDGSNIGREISRDIGSGMAKDNDIHSDIEPNQNLTPLLQVKDLSFSYDDKNQVLKNISFEVFQGQKVALVGRTGSGKTSLVSLLQRFYLPHSHSILLNGKDINTISLDELRRSIVVLRQEEFLFKGDIRTNIQLGNPMASESMLEAVRQQSALSYDLDTVVDEMGANLSAGEKQLVALARVLLFDPEIVILDEATSHIDSISERKVLKAMDHLLKDRTSIIIAHRLNTVMNSDLVIVLKDGMIVEKGTPSQLIENKGHFSSFYNELL